MEFIKDLKPTSSTLRVSNLLPFDEDTTFRMFEGFKLKDDLWLSVQASYGHYCSPRKTLLNLEDYRSMEFALMDKEGNFTSVSEILPDFPKLEEIEEYRDTVYAYVPVNLINELYKALKSL